MKRILTLVLVLAMVLSVAACFASCGGGIDPKEDWKRIEERGYFTCGVTPYPPMNFKDDKGEWTGFDTEFAIAVAKELGVEAKFQEIEWGSKYTELNSGKIDFIWNGFTYGDEDGVSRTEYVDFTHSYFKNTQCVVVKAADLAKYTTKESLKGKTAAVEGGSSGEGEAKAITDEAKVVGFDTQARALNDLASGAAVFAVVDKHIADAMVGKNDYANLAVVETITFEPEVYAIGARKGSDMTAKVNAAIEKLSENGTLAALAEKYGKEGNLIPNIGKGE